MARLLGRGMARIVRGWNDACSSQGMTHVSCQETAGSISMEACKSLSLVVALSWLINARLRGGGEQEMGDEAKKTLLFFNFLHSSLPRIL